MRGKLKPVSEQVIVVTGASSGLGLDAAKAAAGSGASVVLAAGDAAGLGRASEEILAAGGRAYPVTGDPSTPEGADQIARAAAARYGRFDTWIDASGDTRNLAHAAEAVVRHVKGRGGPGVLVGFGSSLDRAVRAELRRGRGAVALTMIRLPPDWTPASPSDGIVSAALYAAARPLKRLDVATGGETLTAATELRKHSGALVLFGLAAATAVATWMLREEIAAQARPRVRRLVIEAARRNPRLAVRLAVRHPREAWKLARRLR